MYKHQKGVLPFITSALGVLIPCGFFINALIILIPGFADTITSMPFGVAVEKSIQFVVGLVLYLFFPFLFGVFFSGMFPSVQLAQDGLKYSYFSGLIRKKIKWEEIEKLVELDWGVVAVVIDRPGLSILNGLYLNNLYGKIVRLRVPIILLSTATRYFEDILHEITQRISKTSTQIGG